nr:hypothetical protein [Fodinicola feengrottensis]
MSATCASRDSAGWQQVKISRSQSSSTTGGSVASSGPATTSSVTNNGSAERNTDSRRNRSFARLRATVVSQAPGREGTPFAGQSRNARAYAS